MFMEDVPDYKFTGLAWLFMGVANSDARLYDDEFQAIAKKYPKQASAGRIHSHHLPASFCNMASIHGTCLTSLSWETMHHANSL